MSGSREQLASILELLLNEDTEKASELLHEYVVGKAREEYERVLDEDESEFGYDDEAEDYEDEIDGEETGQFSEDEEDGEEGDDDVIDKSDDFVDDVTDTGDEEGGDELDFDDAGEEGEGDVEDRVEDLEAELDDLRAEFERLMGDEEGMDDEMGGDMDMDMDMGGDEFGGDDMDMDMGGDEEEYDLEESGQIDQAAWKKIVALKNKLMGPNGDKMEPEEAQEVACDKLGYDSMEVEDWLDMNYDSLEEATQFSSQESEQPVKSAKGLKGSEADNTKSPYTQAPKPTKVGADGAKTFHNKDGGEGKKDHGAGVKANSDKGTDHNIKVPQKKQGSHTYGSGAKDGKTDVDGGNKQSPYTKIPK